MPFSRRFVRVLFAIAILWVALPTPAIAQKVNVILKNGMIIGPGTMAEESTIKEEASVNSSGATGAKVIVVVDDGLRQVYFNNAQRVNFEAAPNEIKILFPNKDLVSKNANSITAFAASPQTLPFDALGRRFYRFNEQSVAVQGITEVTPQYVRVQGLRGAAGEYVWDMRMAMSSIPADTLRKILIKNADPTKAKSYQEIVDLYWAARRYIEAREMLVIAMQRFPELETNRPLLKQLDQLAADQLFVESANAKKRAGQHELAKRILDSFDYDLLSIETKLKVERQKELIGIEEKDRENLLVWIEEDISKVSDAAIQQKMQEVLVEIRKFLSPDTAGRFADYLNLRNNAKPDQRAALAIGGWVFGSGLAEENLSLVASSIQARKVIQEYLAAPVRNDQLLEELSKLESGTPRYVSRIVANIPPPVAVPESASQTIRTVPNQQSPEEVVETKVEGRFLLEVPQRGALQGYSAYYLVQLPPEYNPYRRYPCIVTMHGESSTPEEQIQWWCGSFDPATKRCWGEASRNGYIVVAPYWGRPKQPSYNYTENEHSFVLSTLYDAMKRFSIDTDRIFLSGHMSGGEGAWDIALAHPDLWAGCVCISGVANKYIRQYWTNAEYVPFYFVTGQLAAASSDEGLTSHKSANERVWDNFLKERSMDVMITVYNQRGLDHYQEELPRIFEWLNLPDHVRNFAPKKFSVRTSRAGDRFFWWFETDQLFTDKLVHPLRYRAGSEYTVEAEISKESNTIAMRTIPADRYNIWLTPDMVDLNRTLNIIHKSGAPRRLDPKPDTRTLLQDVRQRADRQHPFWLQIPMPK